MVILQIIIFILGLTIGSFLNVCIYRIPEKKSIVFPASHCPNCNHRLSVIDLIPILGFFINKGNCKYCKVKISMQYPIVELLTGIVFLLLFNKFSVSIELLKYAVLSSLLIIITFIDLDIQEIPDELIIFILIAGLLFNIFHIKTDMVPGIIGFVIGGGLFLIIAMITNGAMGGGDIKLMAVLGLFFGWKLIILISLLSFIIGAVISLVLIAFKMKNRKDYIPFAPFISIATFIAIFYGIELLEMYIQRILI